MRKSLSAILILILVLLFSGCKQAENTNGSAPANSGEQNLPTLEEVIGGTWEAYAGFADGQLYHQADLNCTYTLTFDAKGGFSGHYREKDGAIDSSFTGTYDVSDSKKADPDPYRWHYYCTVNKADLKDSGMYGMSFTERLPSEYYNQNQFNLNFNFRDLDGQKLLYEEAMGLYFKKQS